MPTTDPGLIAGLATAIATARVRQCELSLVLLEISNYNDMVLIAGAEVATNTVHAMQAVLNTLAGNTGTHCQVSDARYASVLVGFDRRRGVEFARHVVHTIPNWSLEHCQLTIPVQCIAAVVSSTLPGRAYAPEEFIEAAERCLFAAQTASGNMVKSIDLL